MKKIIIVAAFLFLGSIGISQAACVDFSDGKLCLEIAQDSNNSYRLINAVPTNYTANLPALRCDLTTPDGRIHTLRGCQGNFSYNGNGSVVKIAMTFNRQSFTKFFNYQFNNSSATLGESYTNSSIDYPDYSNDPIYDYDYNYDNNYNNDYYNDYPYYSDNNYYANVQQVTINQTAANGETCYDYCEPKIRVRFDRPDNVSSVEAQIYLDTDTYLGRVSLYRTTINGSDERYAVLPSSIKNQIPGGTFGGQLRTDRLRTSFTYTIRNGSTYTWSNRSSSSNNNGNQSSSLGLSISTNYPNTNQYINTTITLRDEFNSIVSSSNSIIDFSIQQSTNGFRQTISNGYYLRYSSFSFNNSYGSQTISDMVRIFNPGTYYLIARERNTGRQTEVPIYVGGSSSSNTTSNVGYDLLVAPEILRVGQRPDLVIRAKNSINQNTDYQGTVNIVVYRIINGVRQIASSNDFNLLTSSATFNLAQGGQRTLSSRGEARQAGRYVVRITDTTNSSRSAEQEFEVRSSTSYSSLSSDQLSNVRQLYNSWPNFITQLQNRYSNTRNNLVRSTRQSQIYQGLSHLINNTTPRTYTTYTEIVDAIVDFANYTRTL